MQNEVPTLGRMQIRGQGNFAAELVRRTCFALADAFHFRGVPGIEITGIAASLLRAVDRAMPKLSVYVNSGDTMLVLAVKPSPGP